MSLSVLAAATDSPDRLALISSSSGERLTFANLGVYRPELVAGEAATRFKLLPMFQRAMREGRLSGERHDGFWRNLGTPAQLAELESAGWPTSERKE